MSVEAINISVEEMQPSFLYRFRATEKKIVFRKQFLGYGEKPYVTQVHVTGWAVKLDDEDEPYFIDDELPEVRCLCQDNLSGITCSPTTNFQGYPVKVPVTCLTDFLLFVKKLKHQRQ